MNRKIIELAKKYNDQTAQFLVDMASIQSLSCGEKKVVQRIKQEMESVPFDDIKIDNLGNIIGRIGNGPVKIAFDAHIDTVDVGNRNLWEFDPFDGHIKDGKVFGRGTADQEGGMASMITAARIIKELKLAKNCTLYFTGTVMEEDCDGLCWNYLIREEKIKPDFVVITEPTGCNIYRGHRGRMEIEITLTGLSAHGSAPDRGINAIYKAAPIIAGIEQLNEKLIKDEFLGKGTVVVSNIKSNGPSLCAVPDFCSIYLDRRLTWGETKESAIAEIQEILDINNIKGKIHLPEYDNKSYTGIVYKMEKYYPTWKMEENHEIVQKSIVTYKDLFNNNPKVDKWTFSTNGVTIRGVHGIPCIGFGPGYEEQAHAPNEFCPVDHLWKATAFYAAFADKFKV